MEKSEIKKIASLRKKQSKVIAIEIKMDNKKLVIKIPNCIGNLFPHCNLNQSDNLDTEHLKVTKNGIEIK